MKNYVCDICGKEIPRQYVCGFKIKEKYASISNISINMKRDICYECACDIINAFVRLVKEKREANNGS